VTQQNLADGTNVTVHVGDGTQFDPGECDDMLINAGLTHPLPLCLDLLRQSGRLLLPITVTMAPNLSQGVMLKIIRQPNGYATQLVSFVAIYSATNARNPQREVVLGKALATGALMKVKFMHRDPHGIEDSCAACSSRGLLPVCQCGPPAFKHDRTSFLFSSQETVSVPGRVEERPYDLTRRVDANVERVD
jgi:hypothetical protein